MRVLITGGRGQLARELIAAAPPGIQLRAVDRSECDIGEFAKVEQVLASFQPHLVINTAAYTAVDAAEDNEDGAFRTNTRGAANVATAARLVGSRLIHISTNYIFDGQGSTPYPPDALARPLNVYGKSKYAGEQAVRLESPDALIIRSGWLYSSARNNFLTRILGLLRAGTNPRVVADQRGTPTLAADLARVLWLCTTRLDLSGTYHFANTGETTWYEFAREIRNLIRGKHLSPRVPEIIPITAAEYNAPAMRPSYSVLDSSALLEILGCDARPWEVALRQAITDIPTA